MEGVKIREIPAIHKAKLILTGDCQLNCKYCYESHSKKSMSFDTAKLVIDNVIDNVPKYIIPEIAFFGGEPLILYEEVMKPCIDYIRDIKKSRCSISFTTNGLLLDEDKLNYFKSKNINFMLSLDGCKLSHDTNRVYKDGRGSFSDIEDKFPIILKYYPNMRARMTLTPSNVKYLYDSVRYIESRGFMDIHIMPDLLNSKWSDNDFQRLNSQMRLIEDCVIETFENQEIPLIFCALSDMFTRIVLSMHNERIGHHRSATCCDPNYRCGIGVLGNITVDTDGSVYTCPHISMTPSVENIFYLGNFSSGIDIPRISNLINLSSSPIKCHEMDCSECPLDNICTGGCTPNNYILNGDLTSVPKSYCMWVQSLYNSALNIIRYFDTKQDNLLFKDYFYGIVKRGVRCVC